MPIFSMTGFGKSETIFNNTPCVIEIRSVNSRFLDIFCRLPPEFCRFENMIRGIVKSRIKRGSVNVTITLGEAEVESIPSSYSEKTVAAFLSIIKDMKTQHPEIQGNIQLSDVLALPGVIQHGNLGATQEVLEKYLTQELNKALDALIAMREKEGANMVADLKVRVETLDKYLEQIKELDPKRITRWRDKFDGRLKELMQDYKIDPVRVLQEASIIADRLDINEEITRFKSHNKLFVAALNEGGTQGKKLNFILQEMGREANTLGTKCQDAEIATYAIKLKDGVETIREQVMNIE